MYSFDIKEDIDKIFGKISKKDPKQFEAIYKKIAEVIENPQHYKNLRSPLQNFKRVRVGKSFVLVFSVDEENRNVLFEYYDHHDKGRVHSID